MTTHDALLAIVTRWPFAKDVALVYVDWLMEYEARDRWSALKVVARLRRAARNARELKQATKLLSDASPVRENLLRSIMHHTRPIQLPVNEVFIVPGSRPPTSVRVSEVSIGHILFLANYTVGARWVIREAEEIRLDLQEVFRRPRKRKVWK